MIKKIRIENFRCIRELEMDLEPLTVLVGPNASGKSTVLAALNPKSWNDRNSVLGGLAWKDDQSNFGAVGAPRRAAVKEGKDLTSNVHDVGVYQLDLRAMRRSNEVAAVPHLASDGADLANAFATLPRRKRADVATELVRLVDAFGDVDVRPVKSGHHWVVLQDRWDERRWFKPNEVSDGTLFVLAFLILQHQERRPQIIGLEEPERGLHPYLLGQVIDLLRAISQGKHGPATQFVLATQSAELLDHVQPHEVRFLERDAEGGVQVRTAPVDDEAWANAIHEYENSVGQMWLSGSLGGVPGAQ